MNIADGVFDFPLKGICFIKDCNYEEFEKDLEIFKISKENYFKKIDQDTDYIMNFETNQSTLYKLRDKVNFFLKKLKQLMAKKY